MLLKEIDLPSRLLKAPDQGRLIIFAGAGVSIPAPSNYPSFEDLALHIGQGSPLSREPGERLERYLGRLHSAGVAVHERAVERLTDPASRPTAVHEALIRLFSSSSGVRIVTTNFDAHFTTALANRFPTEQPTQYRAPALPVGSRFAGVVYLHGFVRGAASELVLTDADFGRAYLTEGWARRFLLDLFSAEELFVLFVGYSADDPPVQYLTRALPVQGSDRRFALTPADRADHWRHLGITPLTYSKREDEADRHGALAESVAEWVRYTHLGALGHEAQIREILTLRPPLDVGRQSYLLECLTDNTQRRFFMQHATSEWLPWAHEQGLLPILLPSDQTLDESKRDLSRWCALQVCVRPDFLLELLAHSRSALLNPTFWRDLLGALNWSETTLAGHTRAALVALLLQSAPAGDYRRDWLRVLERTDADDTPDLVLALLDQILKPRIEVDAFGLGGARLDLSSEHSFNLEFRRIGESRIATQATVAPGLLSLLERHLRIARALIKGARPGKERWNVLSIGRAAIEPHAQNFNWSPLGALIDATRDTLASLLRSQPDTGRAVIERWSRDPDDQLFVRFAINAVREDSSRGADERIAWLTERQILYRYGLKHEVFQLLAAIYPKSSAETRRALIEIVERGDPEFEERPDDPDAKRTYDYEIYNVLVWLNRVAPECPLAKERLTRAQERNPIFGPRLYADFDSWVGPVSEVERGSPVDLLRMTPTELAHQAVDWRDADALAQAVGRDVEWSWQLVQALERENLWSSPGHWHGVLRGWTKALVGDEAWARALDYLIVHAGDLQVHLGAIADLLLESVKSKPKTLPEGCRRAAFVLARTIVELSFRNEESPAIGEDLLTQAINHPVGKIAEFWVQAAEDSHQGAEAARSLASDVAVDAARALNGRGRSSLYAVAVLASQLHYLHSLNPAWANSTLLPLFDWSRDTTVAEAAWHGFLPWGRWTPELLPRLIPYYSQTCERLAQLSERHREDFTRHVAGIFVYAASEGNGLLQRFLSSSDVTTRAAFAHSVGHILGTLGDKEKTDLWNERLDRYWTSRQQGIPTTLEPPELLAMLHWLPILEPVFDVAVDRVVQGKPVASAQGDIFYALTRDGLAVRHAEAVYRLLSHVLPAANRPFYACQYVEELIRILHVSGFESERLRPICEALARLDCDAVRLWRDIGGG